MRVLLKTILATAALACVAMPASAGLVVLDFENINATHPSRDTPAIGAFYNGGTSSAGTSGVNYGVSFSSNTLAMCLNTLDATCLSASHGGLGDPDSQLGAMYFSGPNPTTATMNVFDGFVTSLSWNYVNKIAGADVTIFDGLNGTGNILGSVTLDVTSYACAAEYHSSYCPFVFSEIAFSGEAKSVVFSGYPGFIVFDDIAFHTAEAAVPEPLTLSLFGAGVLGMGALGRRKRK